MLNWIIPVVSVSVFTAVIVCLISLFSIKKTTISSVEKLNTHDIFSAVITLGAVVTILAASTFISGFDSAILNGGSTNHDDISHVSLLQTIFDNQGYDYGTNEEVSGTMIIPQLTAYPLGWHLSQLPFINAVNELGFKLTPWNWQIVYFISKIIGLGLLVFATSRFLLLFTSANKKISETLYIYLVVLTLLALITASFFSTLFALGFYNYIGVFILLLGLLFIVTGEKQEKPDKYFKYFMVYGSLFVAASITTWLLVSPLFGLVLLSIFIGRDLSFKDIFNIIKVNIKPFMVSTMILLVASLQFYIQYKFTIKTNALNEGGGILRFSDELVLGLFVGSIVALILSKKGSKLNSLFAAFMVFGIGAGLLFLYQIATIGEAKYYAIKLLYLPVFVAILIISIYFIKAAELIKRSQGIMMGLLFVVFSALFIPIVFNISTSPFKAMISGKNQVQPATVKIVKDLLSRDDYRNSEYIVYLANQSSEDQAASRILNLSRRYQGECEVYYYGILYDMPTNAPYIPKALKGCIDTSQKTIFVVDSDTKNIINNLLSASSNVEIIER
jgi:hypothetical protein